MLVTKNEQRQKITNYMLTASVSLTICLLKCAAVLVVGGDFPALSLVRLCCVCCQRAFPFLLPRCLLVCMSSPPDSPPDSPILAAQPAPGTTNKQLPWIEK